MTKVQCICEITKADGWGTGELIIDIKRICKYVGISCVHVRELTFELRSSTIWQMTEVQDKIFKLDRSHMEVYNRPLRPEYMLHPCFAR